MTTRMVILGLLRQQPLYGYEIKHILEEEMGDWASIAFGSIYFALGKLAEESLIQRVATEQDGKRPSRTIYEITEAGRQEFLVLLRASWSELERQHFAIDMALAFMNALPRQEVVGYLHRRLASLEQINKHLNAHREEQLARPEVPKTAAAIFAHSQAHYAAELAWTRELLAQVEQEEYGS